MAYLHGRLGNKAIIEEDADRARHEPVVARVLDVRLSCREYLVLWRLKQ